MDELFTRLYARSGTPQRRPLETFSTEALALATDADGRPMLAAIGTIEWHGRPPLPRLSDRAVVFARTQIPLPTPTTGAVRWLDLVLDIRDGDVSAELWAEVKAHAPVSGDQLTVYEAARHERSARLISISPRPLALGESAGASPLPWLPWASISAAIDATAEPHVLWRALQAFLRDQDLIARAGASGLVVPDGGETVLRSVNDRIRASWGDAPLAWTKPGSMINGAITTAQRLDRFATTGGPLEYGYEAGGWFLAVRRANAQAVAVDAAGMLGAAERASLGSAWSRSFSSVDPILIARLTDPAGALPLAQVVGWFSTRIDELRDAGVLDTWLAAWRGGRSG